MKYLVVTIPRKELGTRAEARNKEIKRALKLGADYILMVDDDQAIPIDGLADMRNAVVVDGYDMAIIDAPSKDGQLPTNVTYHPDGTIAWTGFGCVLFKAEIFQKLLDPWFDDSYTYTFEIKKGKFVFTKVDKYKPDNVGEDSNFYFKLTEADYKIKIIEDIKCLHKEIE